MDAAKCCSKVLPVESFFGAFMNAGEQLTRVPGFKSIVDRLFVQSCPANCAYPPPGPSGEKKEREEGRKGKTQEKAASVTSALI